MTERSVARINAQFPITKRDPGVFSRFRASALTVELDWYAAEGLGNVSLLHGSAMAGLMRMETLVINPFARDLPLFSFDRIAALGKQTVLVEYYDTLLDAEAFDSITLMQVKQDASVLPDHDLGGHWYDSIKLPASFAKKANRPALPQLDAAFSAALNAYLLIAAEAPLLCVTAQTEKRAKAAAYVDGLLQNGGPSTDAFVKAIGAEQTRALLAGVVFGTEA